MDQSGYESGAIIDQHVSAAIDNELPEDECDDLVDHLAQSPALQKAWERHHAINALLRGEHIAAMNHQSWDRIHATFAEKELPTRKSAVVLDFASIRDRYLVKVVGGMALAASVVLAVSLFITMQGPASNMSVPLASEGSAPGSSTTPLATPVRQSDPQTPRETLQQTPADQSDAYFVSNREYPQSPVPTTTPNPRNGQYPANQTNPNRDLVRLVSDKPSR